jgi:hypothetical protein
MVGLHGHSFSEGVGSFFAKKLQCNILRLGTDPFYLVRNRRPKLFRGRVHFSWFFGPEESTAEVGDPVLHGCFLDRECSNPDEAMPIQRFS